MVERIFAMSSWSNQRICAYPPGFTFRMTPCVWQFGASLHGEPAGIYGFALRTDYLAYAFTGLLLVLLDEGSRLGVAALELPDNAAVNGAARRPMSSRCWGRPLDHLNGSHRSRVCRDGFGQSLCVSTGGMGPVISTERSMIGLFLCAS